MAFVPIDLNAFSSAQQLDSAVALTRRSEAGFSSHLKSSRRAVEPARGEVAAEEKPQRVARERAGDRDELESRGAKPSSSADSDSTSRSEGSGKPADQQKAVDSRRSAEQEEAAGVRDEEEFPTASSDSDLLILLNSAVELPQPEVALGGLAGAVQDGELTTLEVSELGISAEEVSAESPAATELLEIELSASEEAGGHPQLPAELSGDSTLEEFTSQEEGSVEISVRDSSASDQPIDTVSTSNQQNELAGAATPVSAGAAEGGRLEIGAQAATTTEIESVTANATRSGDLPDPGTQDQTASREDAGAEPRTSESQRFPEQLLSRAEIAPEKAAGNQSGLDGAQQSRFLDRVARAFHAAQGRGGVVRLRLHPPELGAVKIELRVENGALTARLEAETAAARTALWENMPQLKERLQEQGVRIEQFDVDLAGQDDRGRSADADDDLQQHYPPRHTTPLSESDDSGSVQQRSAVAISDIQIDVVA